MRLKILNEDNSVPFILAPLYEADDPVTDSGILGWLSNKGSNFWSWLTGGTARNYTGEGKDMRGDLVHYSSNGGIAEKGVTDASKNILQNTLKDAGSAQKGITVTNQQSVMGQFGDKVKGWGQNMEPFLKDKLTKLGDFIKDNPQTTAIGLAGAGLLGTYYLFKKFKKDKKLTPEEIKNMEKMDNLTPDQVKARMGQNKLQ